MTTTGYSRFHILLHWITALAVVVAWVTHEGMEDIARAVWKSGGAPYPTLHTGAGAVALITILIRLWLRRRYAMPTPAGSKLNQKAAEWGHRALYALVLIVPLLGALSWFGGFRGLSNLHDITAKALMLLALGHAAMALVHQFIKKDGTLSRMLRPGG